MIEENIQLDGKLVSEIEGKFFIPSYQRGYRWDETQVVSLLNDIYESQGRPYCLQPIVVRKYGEQQYELIDGQQRLTTLFIILSYMKTVFPVVPIKYTLEYATRKDNTEFFNHMDDEKKANSYIDFYFIHKAYQTVKNWFLNKGEAQSLYIVTDFLKYFDNSIKVIWYEIASVNQDDAIELFTRLNIGRIPLTNAELVKALFLCKTEQMTKEKQLEISLQWDNIERELHDEDLWYFLTKKKAELYPTRIELLFDFMAGKEDEERDQFYTFQYYCDRRENLIELWDEILRYYYRLKEWYKNNTLYHKVGYLVSSGTKIINELMKKATDMKKSEMDHLLDNEIKESIAFDKPYGELNYENDYDRISKILLLFNVVSLMTNGSNARFPFKEYNNENWSLEHIHAQHSLKLNTQEKWKEWLKLHLESLRDQEGSETLIESMHTAIDNEHLTVTEFNELSNQVTEKLSSKGDVDYVHSLSNMALLQCSANAALNNSLFDVKRRIIKKMDSEGLFIPYCTKMVFLKYYSPDGSSPYFWGETDRMAYISNMNIVLKPYLKEDISYGNR